MKTTEEFLIQSVEGETPELFKKLGVPYWRYEAEVNMKTEDRFDKEVTVLTIVPIGHNTLIKAIEELGWVRANKFVTRYDDTIVYKKHMISDINGVFHPVEEKPEPEKKTAEEMLDEITATLREVLDTEYVGTPMTEQNILDFHKTHYMEQAEYIISVLCDGDNKAGRELLPAYSLEEVVTIHMDIEWLRTPYKPREINRVTIEINLDL